MYLISSWNNWWKAGCPLFCWYLICSKLLSNRASYVFSLVASETGWSECSKTCGEGEKFKMVNNIKQVLPCNTLPCPGWNLLVKYNYIYCLIPKYLCTCFPLELRVTDWEKKTTIYSLGSRKLKSHFPQHQNLVLRYFYVGARQRVILEDTSPAVTSCNPFLPRPSIAALC